MNALPKKLQVRSERKAAKREEKKRQIAESALAALKELGYANTSLRDIAERSDLSLGMLHYYFEGKSDLIIYCVSTYKAAFVENVLQALEGQPSKDAAITAFCEALATSIVEEGDSHKLWYDIRNQSMFDGTFHQAVSEIDRALMNMTGALLKVLGQFDERQVETAYAMVDGVFRMLLQKHLRDAAPQDQIAATFRAALVWLSGRE